jgi:methionyl-tRNA synthetase
MPRDILITSALNYANGSLHLGHMLEVIQADIWARCQRLQGHQCLYLSGADAHGTPIMLAAEKMGQSPEIMVEQIRQAQARDISDFLVDVANYHSTHSDENRELSYEIYARLNTRGDISRQTIEQAFDAEKHAFLPDRFIRGSCPKCQAKDQYGDNCEACGASYDPMDLIDPISVLSGTKPIVKSSEHLFFQLEHHRERLLAWLEAGHLQPEVANKLKEWFQDGLKPWDISRDAPYFGFEIPNEPGKFFYVWLDAPIGYIASLKNLARANSNLSNSNISVEHYWGPNSKAELYHFIGKDIAYFHALFWPAMLAGANYRLPTSLFVHGYLTINGEKMSKSRGTFITARRYLDHLDPEYLRYYLAAKLSPHIEDIDLNLEDFAQRVNSDLVGKYVNLASRCAGFIAKHFNHVLATELDHPSLQQTLVDAHQDIFAYYETRHYQKAVRQIMHLADLANQYIDHEKPWALIKDAATQEQKAKVQAICTQGLNLFRLLSLYLKPILPKTVAKVEAFLAIEPLTMAALNQPLLGHRINDFSPLMQRIQKEQCEELLRHD